MTFIEKAADKLFLLMCSVIDQKCQGSLSCQHRSLKLVHLSSVENTQSKRASRRPSYHAQSENGGTEALVTTGLSPLGEPWSYSAHIRVLGALFWQKGTPVPFHMKANTVLTKLGECRVALIDDIAVSSQTWEDYAEHVKQGFGELLQTSLTVGPWHVSRACWGDIFRTQGGEADSQHSVMVACSVSQWTISRGNVRQRLLDIANRLLQVSHYSVYRSLCRALKTTQEGDRAETVW